MQVSSIALTGGGPPPFKAPHGAGGRRCLPPRGHRLRVAAKARDESSSSSSSNGSSNGSGAAAAGKGVAAPDAGQQPSAMQQPPSVCLPAAECASTDCVARTPVQQRRGAVAWPQKSELYILRSDGHSCTRETVQPSGNLQFACPSSQQQLLVWKTRPRRVMVLKKLGEELLEEYIDVLRYLGVDLGMRVVVEPHDAALLAGLCMSWVDSYTAEDLPDLHSHVDFVVCLGGDGLLLHAASLFGSALPPVISFKLGSLGFLTTHNYVDYRRHLADVVHGCRELESCQLISPEDGRSLLGVHITLRMRLECELWREGGAAPAEVFEVLNEVVVSRGAHPYLSNIEVYERDMLIAKVQADGVMLATPTGSTAYNVAAGGSMVHPSVPAILFTPICPHSLNFRPVILPDYAELDLRVASDARCPAVVCLDGRETRDMRQGDSLRVRMSPNPVPTINNADMTTDWFTSIQRCFQWSERAEQRPLEAGLMSQALSRESSLTSAGSLRDSSSLSQ